jgi:hypothetical protein
MFGVFAWALNAPCDGSSYPPSITVGLFLLAAKSSGVIAGNNGFVAGVPIRSPYCAVPSTIWLDDVAIVADASAAFEKAAILLDTRDSCWRIASSTRFTLSAMVAV